MKNTKHMASNVLSHLKKDIKESHKSIMEDKKLTKKVKGKKIAKKMNPRGY